MNHFIVHLKIQSITSATRGLSSKTITKYLVVKQLGIMGVVLFVQLQMKIYLNHTGRYQEDMTQLKGANNETFCYLE